MAAECPLPVAADTKPNGNAGPAAVGAASMPPRWLVCCGTLSATVEADNEADAWAVFCDTMSVWPGPKVPHTIERV